jgi:ribonuclease HII
MPDWRLEHTLWGRGFTPVAGVDEAGRGALAGPVVVAAVILPVGDHPFDDSKTLAPQTRERLARDVKAVALAWSVGVATAQEVDAFNVLRATHLAAGRAVAGLSLVPAALVTDYLRLELTQEILAPPKADALSLQVAAASILAKTTRDAMMLELDAIHPGYGFARNKGYGSPAHLAALERQGPCPEHRRSFRPVAQGGLFGSGVE